MNTLKSKEGSGVSFQGKINSCDVCAQAKGKQKKHPKTADNHTTMALELVYTDLMGDFKPPAIGGYK